MDLLLIENCYFYSYFSDFRLSDVLTEMTTMWSERLVLDHGWQLSEWLENARASCWLSDVMVRWREGEGDDTVWQQISCHTSVLAAVSPVLRQALADGVTRLVLKPRRWAARRHNTAPRADA